MTNPDPVTFYAQQTVAGSNLDWDYVMFLPADESSLISERTSGTSPSVWILDGDSDAVYNASAADVFVTTTDIKLSVFSTLGAIPKLVPNVTNRVFLTLSGSSTGDYQIAKADTSTVTIYYHPRYLYVRPSTT